MKLCSERDLWFVSASKQTLFNQVHVGRHHLLLALFELYLIQDGHYYTLHENVNND